ncbi:MAG TPA: helix-turn-helix transcriptional regulator [Kofleriaceae bacterium]|mgnify:CR=1 FL=1|nr:helix-turn-helix transcriptional regulator [Kofleriaceae bacterium]
MSVAIAEISKSRERIASKVRSLRVARGWTLQELAKELGVSLSRLSEVERGDGSFTAEQLLVLLRIFNVPVSEFAAPEKTDYATQLQNALAYLGAQRLRESTAATPSDALHNAHAAIRETLLAGSSRQIASLPAVLVRNIERIALPRLHAELAQLGYEARFGWLLDHAIAALDEVAPQRGTDVALKGARLRLHLAAQRLRPPTGSDAVDDILDSHIRSERSLELARKASSAIARKWRIITNIQLTDFVAALRSDLAID